MRNTGQLWSRPEFADSGGRRRRLARAEHPPTPRARLFAVLLGMAWMAMVPAASAIELSHDHAGQYLILPFALATERYDTLIQVNNAMSPPPPMSPSTERAVKLRILDRDGHAVLTGNLYLRRGETWAAALTMHDGAARLITASEACLLIDQDGQIVPDDTPELAFESGFIEWVEMGRITDDEFGEQVRDRDCAGLAARWMDPAWAAAADAVLDPPIGGLKASASLIDVDRGTMYSVTAAALDQFSSVPQHTPPASAEPNLATTFDDGTPAGQTRSVVCHRGECITDTWAEPIDAASAALIVFEARGDFVIAESIGARSEWVVTYPTMAYYSPDHPLNKSSAYLFLADRSGNFLGTTVDIIPQPPGFRDTTYEFVHGSTVNHLDFGQTRAQFDQELPSSVFGIVHRILFPSDPGRNLAIPDSGQARFGFRGNNALDLRSNEGRPYFGRPALIWMFQEFENGVLQSGDGALQRANYGNAFVPSTFPFAEPL